MIQAFKKGDHVRVAKDLGPSMSHFTSDCEAIVIGSYADRYGGSNHNDYTLHLKGHGQSSWYYGHQLELIERNRLDLLKQWEDEASALHKQRSSLDWVFANGPEVLEKGYGSSIEALGKCVGIDNLWGSHGEGLAYYENAMRILTISAPYLEKGDKTGWLELCEKFRLPTADYKIT